VVHEEPVPRSVDIGRPSIARVYDYLLGGKNNFAVDRAAGDAALRTAPDGRQAARANRAFLGRVVRYLAAEAGIRQFLDIGSGLPTRDNVHEMAHRTDPGIPVVYVDSDPMVVAHGRALLEDNRTTVMVRADLREPEQILAHPDVREFIDPGRPVGLLLLAVLHHLDDDEDPAGRVGVLRDALPAGSYLAISHFQDPGAAAPDASRKARELERVFKETLGTGRWRTREQILALLAGLEILEPGLVPLARWRPDPGVRGGQTDTRHTFVGALARRP